MMYYYDNFYLMNMFGFGHVFMLLFWGLVIYGMFALFAHKDYSSNDSVLKILKERYAKGEITKEQFESMKKDIN